MHILLVLGKVKEPTAWELEDQGGQMLSHKT